MSGQRIKTWAVEYLLPYPASPSAVPDAKAKGHYRHREVMIGSSEQAVLRELGQKAAVPVDIREQTAPHPLFMRLPKSFKQQFLTALLFSVEGGLSAGRALEALIEQQTGSIRVRMNLSLDLLRRGQPFVEAFRALNMYDDATLAIIEAGEELGKLPASLRSAAAHLEKSSMTRKLVLGAVTATALDLIFAVSAVVGTRYGMIPEIAASGAGENATPEDVERFKTALDLAIWGNDIMMWGSVLAIVVGLSTAYAYFSRDDRFRARIDGAFLRIPVLRDLLLHTGLSSTIGVMSSLLQGGVPFLPACLITSRGTRMQKIKSYWTRALQGVESGESISRVVCQSPLVPTEQMILAAHQDVKQLARSFEIIGGQRDELAKSAAKKFGVMAFLVAMVYSVLSVLLTLYVVFVQNASVMGSLKT